VGFCDNVGVGVCVCVSYNAHTCFACLCAHGVDEVVLRCRRMGVQGTFLRMRDPLKRKATSREPHVTERFLLHSWKPVLLCLC